MFERFTEEARQVVVLAQGEARRLRHNYLGTEHLLLGILRLEHGVAAEALAALGITLDATREQTATQVGWGDTVEPAQMIPFTPRAKTVLELSLREALVLQHNYIGPEHILLGLAKEDGGVAMHMLRGFGADSERLRAEVGRHLSTARPRPEPGVVSRFGRFSSRQTFRSVALNLRWEYRVEQLGEAALTADRLNELGSEGWELAGVIPASPATTLIFRRSRKPEHPPGTGRHP